MRFIFWGLCMLLLPLASVPARAQTVEASFSLSLTAQATMPTATGSRIVSVRLGTRDLIDEMKEDRGISAKGGKLVMRRPIDVFGEPETWLIVGGQEYLVDNPISEIEVVLPESFFADAEAIKQRSSDGVETSITAVYTDAWGGGSLDEDGIEMTLVGIETVNLRLLTQRGIDLGYVVRSVSSKVMGGMLLDIGTGTPLKGVITGSMSIGSEKIVAP